MRLKTKISLFLINQKLKRLYPESDLKLLNYYNPDDISIGKYSYAHVNIIAYNHNSKIKIGNFCSIAENTKLIIDADHNINTVSTYPFKVKCVKSQKYEALSKGDIIINDDVWIGSGVTILSGVTIGQGAVIAAGAVVCKDVAPYSIVGGVPCSLLKFRFSKNVIDYLLKFDFKKLNEESVRLHIDDLYTPIDIMNLDEIERLFDWFPKQI